MIADKTVFAVDNITNKQKQERAEIHWNKIHEWGVIVGLYIWIWIELMTLRGAKVGEKGKSN